MSAKQELILHICPEEHSIRVENVCDGVTAFKEIALETFYDCVKHSIPKSPSWRPPDGAGLSSTPERSGATRSRQAAPSAETTGRGSTI